MPFASVSQFLFLCHILDIFKENLFCAYWFISWLSSQGSFTCSQFTNHITYKCFSNFSLWDSVKRDNCYLLEHFSRGVREASQQLSAPPCCGPCKIGQKKKNSQHSKVKRKKSLLRKGTLLVQWDDFLIIRESWPQACGCVCFYSPERQERSCYTPADLLIGWGKRDLRIHLLVGWGHIMPL